MSETPVVTRRPVTTVQVTQVRNGVARHVSDGLVTEEPLELRVAGRGGEATTLTVTMRTPGHDFELVAGFLLSEGIITGHEDIEAIRYCQRSEDAEQLYNVVTVDLRGPFEVEAVRRNVMTTASCGICGTTSIEQLTRRCDPPRVGTVIGLGAVAGLIDQLRPSQKVFDRTGGLHAAGLFDALTGALLAVREDVGRHNALDKLVGNGVLANNLPFDDRVLMLSGRVSFEMVQKAAAAGIPIVAAVSAPSSLAVRTARALGVTLIGFVRGDDCTIYAHPERIDLGVGS
ncbi:MAG: formate dehydrogenase accessory sulfurtransferase FdhD [Actinobacteria bacterium]|nr:formate dehydrogenase accessory sulfurtransferase FdhD [Actinomycetota bacterium]